MTSRTQTVYTESGFSSPLSPATPLERPNPFATPSLQSPATSTFNSRAPSIRQNSSGEQPNSTGVIRNPNQTYFRSRRVLKGEIDTPIKNRVKDKKEKLLWIFPLAGVCIALVLTGIITYFSVGKSSNAKFCPILDEDFSSGRLNPDVWTYEQEVGGFGNGEFEQTVTDSDVVFIKDSVLHIKPRLQDASLINQNSVINLTMNGMCTGSGWQSCVASTNITNGTIVPPVRSARLNTKKGASIRYGKVEVMAKIPKGDWLWPAIWMLPVKETYGAWPASGEIDILEARGNNHSYGKNYLGNNVASSTLHWGPDTKDDSYLQTSSSLNAPHAEYGDAFHLYGVEWTEDYIYTYIDTQLLQVLYVPFNERFWLKGNYPPATQNGTRLIDPWSQTGRDSTPFDQPFYLILNVAVGKSPSSRPLPQGADPRD